MLDLLAAFNALLPVFTFIGGLAIAFAMIRKDATEARKEAKQANDELTKVKLELALLKQELHEIRQTLEYIKRHMLIDPSKKR